MSEKLTKEQQEFQDLTRVDGKSNPESIKSLLHALGYTNVPYVQEHLQLDLQCAHGMVEEMQKKAFEVLAPGTTTTLSMQIKPDGSFRICPGAIPSCKTEVHTAGPCAAWYKKFAGMKVIMDLSQQVLTIIGRKNAHLIIDIKNKTVQHQSPQ